MRRPPSFTAATTAGFLALFVQAAQADQPVVEIIALPHWPVERALEPVYAMLEEFGDAIEVVRLDAESDAGEARMHELGLRGHIPALIAIDGSTSYTFPDGHAAEFVNFPGGASSLMGLSGSWTPEDLAAAIRAQVE